jgi:hypothetical protein
MLVRTYIERHCQELNEEIKPYVTEAILRASMEMQTSAVYDLLNDRNSFERTLGDQLMEPIRAFFESLNMPITTNSITPRTTPNVTTQSLNPKRSG